MGNTGWQQEWEPRPPFTTSAGLTVWPFFAPGAHGDRCGGGTVRVFDHDIALDDLDDAKHLGLLTWTHLKTVEYVGIDEPWQRQGIATMMWKLAREVEPELHHSTTHRSAQGEAWIRSVSPEEALPHGAWDKPEQPVPQPRAVRLGDRVRRFLRRH